jgi:hypothetical protein
MLSIVLNAFLLVKLVALADVCVVFDYDRPVHSLVAGATTSRQKAAGPFLLRIETVCISWRQAYLIACDEMRE